ncbi:hypothetical protein TIFTF001_031776 [Ficus carica]|uniref:Uncharacterized protein n=1 Tax=Ficus carica TaxID=3494 RepID=A0AA88J4R5_FICCA|nr:hypothetical protein TIFTF001_031776 [Ficus carica]
MGRQRGRQREEKRKKGEDRERGSPAAGRPELGPEVGRRRPSPVAERLPTTERTWGGKVYMR